MMKCAEQALKGLRHLHTELCIGPRCAAAAQAAARSFRTKFGPGADRKIWKMAAIILPEAILLGRHDGIDDLAAAAYRPEGAKARPALVEGVRGSAEHRAP